MWRCPRCGSKLIGDIQPSLDPRWVIGRCKDHGHVVPVKAWTKDEALAIAAQMKKEYIARVGKQPA